MKKFIAVILIFLSLVLFGCEKKPTPDKGYVVLSFVTGFELEIDPVVLDGKEEKYMPEDPMRAGYDFMGWYYDEDFHVPFKTSDEITGDLVLYAKWKKKENESDVVIPPTRDTLGLKYAFADDKYSVTGYDGTATSIVIPSRYNGYPVMEIADYAFKASALKSISFGRNVIKIGENAFRGATELEEINVESGSIYFSSKEGILFNNDCSTIITVPQKRADKVSLNVGVIYPYAFEGCDCEVEFVGSDYRVLEGLAFAGFGGHVVVGKYVTEIRKDAFKGATCSITFEAGNAISSLQSGAFGGYEGERLVIPGTVGTLGQHVFDGCKATVDLSRMHLSTIPERAFAGYEGEKLVIPATVTKIAKNAFYRAKTEITFEGGSMYTEIAAEAFAGFGGAADKDVYSGKVTFPSSVTKVNENAFYGSYSYVYFESARSDIVFNPDFDTVFSEKTFKGKVFFKNI